MVANFILYYILFPFASTIIFYCLINFVRGARGMSEKANDPPREIAIFFSWLLLFGAIWLFAISAQSAYDNAPRFNLPRINLKVEK